MADPQRSAAAERRDLGGTALKVLSSVVLICGAALIGFSCWLRFPPGSSALCTGLWVIGILLLLTSLMGFLAGSKKRIKCCLAPFLTFAVAALLAQLGFLIYLFAAPAHAADSVASAGAKHALSPDTARSVVSTGRWVFLGLWCTQLASVLVALVLRCCVRRSNSYRNFEVDLEQQHAAHTASMNAKMDRLRASVLADGKGASAGGAASKKIALTAVASTAHVPLGRRASPAALVHQEMGTISAGRMHPTPELAVPTLPPPPVPSAAEVSPSKALFPAPPPQRGPSRLFRPTWGSKIISDPAPTQQPPA